MMVLRARRSKPAEEQPLVAHLVELRNRLLRSLLYVAVVFVALLPFSDTLYTLLAEPLMTRLPSGSTMIATEVAAPLLIPFKFTLMVAVFAAMPLMLHELWGFIAPGLYQVERRLALPLVISSGLLFYLGVAFAYFVVFPLVFGFFIGVAPQGVTVMTDIGHYLDFVLKMFFAFGIAFEVPIATILVVKAGLIDAQRLAAKRPYVVVGAFVIGMLLTPPDVVSQTLLALPIWFLFELGLFFTRFIRPIAHSADNSTATADEADNLTGRDET